MDIEEHSQLNVGDHNNNDLHTADMTMDDVMITISSLALVRVSEANMIHAYVQNI